MLFGLQLAKLNYLNINWICREINEIVYEAYVKEKHIAIEEYISAVKLGQTSAHVEYK